MRFMMIGVLASAALASVASAQTPTAKMFAAKAGASDLYERDASRLVLQSTTNADLKRFAQQMVTDHTTSTATIKAAAMKAGMKVAPPKLDAMESANMAKLRAARGSERDTLYVEQQKAAHQEALALMTDYAANGSSKPLKAAAGKIAPVVQHHIDMLASM